VALRGTVPGRVPRLAAVLRQSWDMIETPPISPDSPPLKIRTIPELWLIARTCSLTPSVRRAHGGFTQGLGESKAPSPFAFYRATADPSAKRPSAFGRKRAQPNHRHRASSRLAIRPARRAPNGFWPPCLTIAFRWLEWTLHAQTT
jgi:hypothetical protein